MIRSFSVLVEYVTVTSPQIYECQGCSVTLLRFYEVFVSFDQRNIVFTYNYGFTFFFDREIPSEPAQ